MANQFRFASPVEGDFFAGRRHEIDDLTGHVLDHQNVSVISPRRFGKTSLINAMCARAARRGATVARTDAMLANVDIGHFASRLVTAVYSGAGPWRKAKDSLSEFAKTFAHFQPSISIGTDGPSFSFSSAQIDQDPTAIIAHAYGLMAGCATPVLVVDEFQELTKMPGNMPGVFKALADEHPDVAMVIAGSKEHMMHEITADSRGALYGMTYRLDLKTIPADEMGDYVQRRFNVGAKPITRELADHITALAGPVPNDIQHLAYDVYAAVESARAVTADDVEAGLRDVVDQIGGAFVDVYSAMTGNQRRLLSVLATAPTRSPRSASLVRLTGYANPSSVMRGLESLRDSDIVGLRDGQWQVIDPFLSRWLVGHSG